MRRPTSTRHLFQSERRFAAAMNVIGHGRFESVGIEHGELVLDPWPTTVRCVKFGSEDPAANKPVPDDFELKVQVADFFDYVRGVDSGEIRRLELRHGLPFLMEIAHYPNAGGGRCG